MDRRSFLEMLKNLGLAGAIGIPVLGAKGMVEGDIVEVTNVGKTVYKYSGFRLFADPSADRLGVVYEYKDMFLTKRGDRTQFPLSKALEAIRNGAQPEVRLETIVAYSGIRDVGVPARLYVDRGTNEFGILEPNGDEKAFIPLSSVLQLLKKAEVL